VSRNADIHDEPRNPTPCGHPDAVDVVCVCARSQSGLHLFQQVPDTPAEMPEHAENPVQEPHGLRDLQSPASSVPSTASPDSVPRSSAGNLC